MDLNKNKELLSQIRTAHRLLASYYNRVHQLIRDVSDHDDLNLDYLSWGPTAFAQTPQRSSKVLDRWPWDLLPGVAAQYVFVKSESISCKSIGDWLIAFHVVNDDGIFGEGKTSEALDLHTLVEDAHSVLRCYIIAPHKPSEVKWSHNSVRRPECTNKPELTRMDDDGYIYAVGFEMPLEELMGEDNVKVLVKKIIEYRDAVLPDSEG